MLKIIRMPQGSVNIIVHGILRFEIVEFVQTDPYLKARVAWSKSRSEMTKKLQALVVNVRNTASRVIALSPNVPEEAAMLLENINDPSALGRFSGRHSQHPALPKNRHCSKSYDPRKRLEKISLPWPTSSKCWNSATKSRARFATPSTKTSANIILQEELKAIQAELGQDDRNAPKNSTNSRTRSKSQNAARRRRPRRCANWTA